MVALVQGNVEKNATLVLCMLRPKPLHYVHNLESISTENLFENSFGTLVRCILGYMNQLSHHAVKVPCITPLDDWLAKLSVPVDRRDGFFLESNEERGDHLFPSCSTGA